ncbi:MAG: Ppx/GppA phosphatase family protein [Solirubrobacteraceae bacterium]
MARPTTRPAGDFRVAVVDIGSNSTRLLIADVGPGGRLRERRRHSGVTRLGEGVDAERRLKPAAIDRVCRALDVYAEMIAADRCDAAIAVLTSAVRDSANGAEFAALVADRYRLDARVISGDDEARMTFLGATGERDGAAGHPTLVIDIGGGSTELILGTGRTAFFHVSLQAGVVRQTERHLPGDPPTPRQLSALRADLRRLIDEHVPAAERRLPRAAIAVAGTATSCAAIDQGLHPYDPARVHGYRLELATCRLLLARLAGLPLAERRRVRGLHPDRAPTILAGVAMLIELLEAFDLTGFETSEHDILRGAALDRAGYDRRPPEDPPISHPSGNRTTASTRFGARR